MKPLNEYAQKVFSPAKLNQLELRNRVIRTATFEGMCPDGRPSQALIDHHRKTAAGGVGLATVAYCSVSPDGRSYPIQMLMREEILPDLEKLTSAIHEEGAAASLQLGHCGFFASKKVIGQQPMGPSRIFDAYHRSFSRPMTEADMERTKNDFATAAELAVKAGFDAVEIHLGHGYLLSQFLSPYSNRRKDEYGGSLENRTRFPREVLRAVRERIPVGVPILAKHNIRDGFKGGMEIDESIEIARRIESDGSVDALILSAGFVSKAPLYMMKGDAPLMEMIKNEPSWFNKVALFTFGRLVVQGMAFEELYFLDWAKRYREVLRMPLVLVGGAVARKNLETAMEEGFDFVAMGRALIHDPNILRKWQTGECDGSECIPCNLCITEMDRGGVRCVISGE